MFMLLNEIFDWGNLGNIFVVCSAVTSDAFCSGHPIVHSIDFLFNTKKKTKFNKCLAIKTFVNKHFFLFVYLQV